MAGKEEVSANTLSLERLSFRKEGPEYGGLEAIERHCSRLYPDQLNPLQATALVKFWMGGSDPLDYISMYLNHGDIHRGIPQHWHYITYGFSDLYGDKRVHQRSGVGEASGFGFELTFRLKKEDNETVAPMWPAGLLNKLAKYVFQTGNTLHEGDHIPWHASLDEKSDSRIRHMLVTIDPELPAISTQLGTLSFRQIVGVTDDEVKAARRWKGTSVLDLLPAHKLVGVLYITDLNRYNSVFDISPEFTQLVREGIEREGSSLGHVTAVCTWHKAGLRITAPSSSQIQRDQSRQGNNDDINLTPLDSVVLKFDEEAAELLPLVVKARLRKGKFFVFHSASNYTIHLVPYSLRNEHVMVSKDEPLLSQEHFLQIFCSPDLIEQMTIEFENLAFPSNAYQRYPKEFKFCDPSLLIQIFPRGQLQ